MASSSSSSSSYLNSTCGLLAFLDLNENHTQNMEDMENELVVDVPDTPDRLAARQFTDSQFVHKETDSSLSSHLRNSDFMMEKRRNGMKGMGLVVDENAHNSRFVSSPKNTPSDDVKGRRNSIVFPSKENSLASQNKLLFRRAGMEKQSSQGMKPFIGPRRVDKKIYISVDSPSKAPFCQENTALPNIREHDHEHKSQKVFRHVTARDYKTADTSKEDSSRYMPNALMKPNINYKGKEKVIDDSYQDVGLSTFHRKGFENFNDANNRRENQILAPLPSMMSQRATGQKRLVRNGCISPHNIATKAKDLAEQHGKSSSSVDLSELENIASSGPPSRIDIQDIVAEDNYSYRAKGKGVISTSSISQDDAVRVIHAPSSDIEKAIGINVAGGSRLDTFKCSEVAGGWRRTHNHSRKVINLSESPGSSLKKINKVERRATGKMGNLMERQIISGQEHRVESDCAGYNDAAQRASSILPSIDLTSGPCQTERKFNKRQKKQGSTSQNNISCRIPDVMYLDSSGESSNSKFTRFQSSRIRDDSNEIIEVGELSPEMRHPISQAADCPNDDQSADRVRQVEADEMLARELQEQLYQEMPVGGVEIDEHIAMALQQVENGLRASSRGSRSRGSLVAQANRRPRSQSSQSSSNRRVTPARVTHSTRMAQLRNQFFGGTHRASSRQRNINFPMHMDLDMRLDILEALEAAVGDVGNVGMNNDIFHIQRDFTENDYEMLLSLDENNHRHAGASANRINTLPQSTVQTDGMEECAICLETPTIGEVIRHLPCLHKFHKDCIDPWLHRRTSCPVCKSSIT